MWKASTASPDIRPSTMHSMANNVYGSILVTSLHSLAATEHLLQIYHVFSAIHKRTVSYLSTNVRFHLKYENFVYWHSANECLWITSQLFFIFFVKFTFIVCVDQFIVVSTHEHGLIWNQMIDAQSIEWEFEVWTLIHIFERLD